MKGCVYMPIGAMNNYNRTSQYSNVRNIDRPNNSNRKQKQYQSPFKWSTRQKVVFGSALIGLLTILTAPIYFAFRKPANAKNKVVDKAVDIALDLTENVALLA